MDPDIRVRAALDSDPADPAPVWTDITDRVHYGDGGGEVRVTIGRQDETAEIKPTEMSWAVRNGDNAMTPNNSASPYAGKWEQGRRVQIAEVVGGTEYLLATGFLEIPDMQIVDSRSSQPVTVSAVDWMGRLESAPPFEGTLAEHVRTQGGNLTEWYPLSESANDGRYLSAVTGTVTDRVILGFGGVTPIAAEPDELLKPADADGPPGDDQRYARWAPVGDQAGLSTFADARLRARLPATTAASDVVAVSAWVLPGYYAMAAGSEEPGGEVASLYNETTGAHLRIRRQIVNVTGAPDLSYPGTSVYLGSGTTQFLDAGREWERDSWRLITARINLATGLHELWVGADLAVSQTIPTGGAQTYTHLEIGSGVAAAIGHVQVRIGPAATTMTRQMHLEQYAHGYRGLHRQTVADRIVTLAGYAGVPPTEVVVPAACSTPMQPARLAGAGPAEALRRAAATGQDILVTDGAGRLTAVPRSQRYNQPVALAIPFGWIGYRGLRFRPDKPVTDVTVTRTGGGSVRRTDRALAQRYGVTGQQYELDTAIDADPANLVSWAVTAFGQSRTRAPSIRISMMRRTVAERQQLLALKVGDRIQLTGLPAGSPDDVGHLVVQGIEHTIGPGARRYIQFNTSPLLGPSPGVPPAAPVVGAAAGGLNPARGFEDGTVSGWSADAGAVLAASSVRAQQGSWSMRLTPPGGVAVVGARTGNLPVTASARYLAHGWVYVPAGWPDVSLAVDWRTASAFISSSFGPTTSVSAGSWLYLSTVVQAPATAAFAQLRVRVGGTAPATTQVWWDEVDLSPATLVGPSTVVAY